MLRHSYSRQSVCQACGLLTFMIVGFAVGGAETFQD